MPLLFLTELRFPEPHSPRWWFRMQCRSFPGQRVCVACLDSPPAFHAFTDAPVAHTLPDTIRPDCAHLPTARSGATFDCLPDSCWMIALRCHQLRHYLWTTQFRIRCLFCLRCAFVDCPTTFPRLPACSRFYLTFRFLVTTPFTDVPFLVGTLPDFPVTFPLLVRLPLRWLRFLQLVRSSLAAVVRCIWVGLHYDPRCTPDTYTVTGRTTRLPLHPPARFPPTRLRFRAFPSVG